MTSPPPPAEPGPGLNLTALAPTRPIFWTLLRFAGRVNEGNPAQLIPSQAYGPVRCRFWSEDHGGFVAESGWSATWKKASSFLFLPSCGRSGPGDACHVGPQGGSASLSSRLTITQRGSPVFHVWGPQSLPPPRGPRRG